MVPVAGRKPLLPRNLGRKNEAFCQPCRSASCWQISRQGGIIRVIRVLKSRPRSGLIGPFFHHGLRQDMPCLTAPPIGIWTGNVVGQHHASYRENPCKPCNPCAKKGPRSGPKTSSAQITKSVFPKKWLRSSPPMSGPPIRGPPAYTNTSGRVANVTLALLFKVIFIAVAFGSSYSK
jgi:hypothetical protein